MRDDRRTEMPTKGLFRLETPRDLLGKLIHDYQRLQQAPDDAYAAFDFLVTAEHMLDWLYPGAAGRAKRTAERNGNVILDGRPRPWVLRASHNPRDAPAGRLAGRLRRRGSGESLS